MSPSIRPEVLKTEFFEPLERIDATLRHHGRWQGNSIQCKRDGTRVTTVSCSTLQRDADGTPIRTLSIDEDISVMVNRQAEYATPPDDRSRVAAD
jgi:hypothetical protein